MAPYWTPSLCARTAGVERTTYTAFCGQSGAERRLILRVEYATWLKVARATDAVQEVMDRPEAILKEINKL
jgi:hypothetical protein